MGREATSSQRIAEMMDKLNITQADIVRTTKIPKSTLSNYLNGKRNPDQDGLSVIADPYGINPAWLMGYDVPMFLEDITYTFRDPSDYTRRLLAYAEKMRELSSEAREIIFDQIDYQLHKEGKDEG